MHDARGQQSKKFDRSGFDITRPNAPTTSRFSYIHIFYTNRQIINEASPPKTREADVKVSGRTLAEDHRASRCIRHGFSMLAKWVSLKVVRRRIVCANPLTRNIIGAFLVGFCFSCQVPTHEIAKYVCEDVGCGECQSTLWQRVLCSMRPIAGHVYNTARNILA
ncbi:hypothetical protein BKA70DRAFT_1255853 [Coprinopsis sp. MPI-PUGE-AT-0042]|nr:hypothetical protein BKA70DRAFT_1255853 [Coprinopsis sp. MPI-PUGE-AT-0042]